MKNPTHWTEYLPCTVYVRLGECRTKKTDLPILLEAKWKWAQDTGRYSDYTKEDFLVDILDLLDCNGLYSVTEFTHEEWNNLVQ